jgi:8-oxo-dGTP pyrophosphatase MutT (NUDIX family)
MEIQCVDLFGNTVYIPEELIKPSSRVYAIITRENSGDTKLLVVKIRSTGKFYLPGGGIDDGETEEQALRRELREEANLEVTVKEQLPVTGCIYFHHNTYKETWCATVKFYSCDVVNSLDSTYTPDDVEAIDPAWVSINQLSADSFQKGIGEYIMAALLYHQSKHPSF